MICPTCIWPWLTPTPPNHKTPTTPAFMNSIIIGSARATARATSTDCSINALLACEKRRISRSPRTKALTTRTPDRFSRVVSLTPSSRSWTSAYIGVALRKIQITTAASAGISVSGRNASSGQVRTAIVKLPIISSGARIRMRIST
ncbi:MAG: hypothetical protein BWZ10_02246 [candidate division BRC1 bacterium ADurb.BinA364]|nr:MAG: hypothetical protein BWZ10_02246 [candidate division BRC1 bacterium ADurb.BinA364]